MTHFLTSICKGLKGTKIRLILSPQGIYGAVIQGKRIRETFQGTDFQVIPPKYPLEILMDHPDLFFDPIKTPPLSTRELKKLLRHKADDIRETDLKVAYINPNPNSTAPAQVIHLKRDGTLDQWLQDLASLKNPVLTCDFLPLQIPYLSDKLVDEPKAKYTLFIAPHMRGNVRHVLSEGTAFLGTRLTELPPHASLETQVKHLEQEIYNSLSYLRKLAPQDYQQVDLILVLSDELKVLLSRQVYPVKRTYLFTPSDVAHKLGFQVASSNNLSPFFLRDSTQRTSFSPREFHKKRQIHRATRWMRRSAFMIFLATGLTGLGLEWAITRVSQEITQVTQENQNLSLVHLKKSENLKPIAPLTPGILQHLNLETKIHTHPLLIPFIEKVGLSLSDAILLHKLEWQRDNHHFKSVLYLRINDRVMTKQEILTTFHGVTHELGKHIKGANIDIKSAPFASHHMEKFSSTQDQSQDGILEVSFAPLTAEAP